MKNQLSIATTLCLGFVLALVPACGKDKKADPAKADPPAADPAKAVPAAAKPDPAAAAAAKPDPAKPAGSGAKKDDGSGGW